MERTANLAIPYLLPNQASKHVTVNDALSRLDLIVQAAVEDAESSLPPPDPRDGQCFIVGAEAQGEWSGMDGQLVGYVDGSWRVITPQTGWRVWLKSLGELLVFDGSAWRNIMGSEEMPSQFAINTDPDAYNRFAVKSDAILFSHDDVTPGSGDMRLQINRADENSIASLIFATGFTGQFEVGLSAGGNFVLRRNDDSGEFRSILNVESGGDWVHLHAPLALTPADPEEGTVLMRFNIDREWQIEQYRDGTNSGLAFRSLVNGRKSISFLNEDRSREIRFIPDESAIEVDGSRFFEAGSFRPERFSLPQHDIEALPDASADGEGAIIVLRQNGHPPRLALSDGAVWRLVDAPNTTVP